jgi:hypothetical protein
MAETKKEFFLENEQVVTKQDLETLRKRINSDEGKRDMRQGTLATGRKLIRNVGQGFNDIAKSLNTPSTKRRPRISQLPNLHKADITNIPDLEYMKHHSLRGKDIRGHKSV